MKRLIILAVVLVSGSAWANGEDLENCLTRDGAHIEQKVCDLLRKEKSVEDAHQKRQAEYLEQSRHQQAERDAEKAKKQAIVDAEDQKRVADLAHQEAENKRYREQLAREERATEKAAAAREQAIKGKCGVDYRQPRIGMALARAQQCVGKFTLKSQINRADGVVSIYTNGYTYINVMDDRVVSWQKF